VEVENRTRMWISREDMKNKGGSGEQKEEVDNKERIWRIEGGSGENKEEEVEEENLRIDFKRSVVS